MYGKLHLRLYAIDTYEKTILPFGVCYFFTWCTSCGNSDDVDLEGSIPPGETGAWKFWHAETHFPEDYQYLEFMFWESDYWYQDPTSRSELFAESIVDTLSLFHLTLNNDRTYVKFFLETTPREVETGAWGHFYNGTRFTPEDPTINTDTTDGILVDWEVIAEVDRWRDTTYFMDFVMFYKGKFTPQTFYDTISTDYLSSLSADEFDLVLDSIQSVVDYEVVYRLLKTAAPTQ